MAAEPEVLILASLYDFATDLVCERLYGLGVPFVRINRETLSKSRVCLEVTTRSLRYTHEAFEWDVSSRLRSVYWRQPVYLRNTPGRPLSIEEQLDRSQWSAFLRGLIIFDRANWINHPAATYAAEVKPYQLSIAHELGMKVPRSMVTNDAATLATADLGEPFALKSIDTVLLEDGDDEIFAYTGIATQKECSDSAFATIPSICQTLLEPKIDIRVTVIGNKVSAVTISKSGEPISGDWRLVSKDALQYDDYQLSEEDAQVCRDLVKRLGLQFGAIDLALTDQGLFFIEINPTGEWGWLVSPTRPLDHEIASLLAGGGE